MVVNSSMNDSFTNEAQETQLKWLNAVQYTMFATIFVVSVIGNTLVCLVIARTPRMLTTRNFLLVNLAVADLTVAMFCIPFEVVLKLTYPRWPLGPVMCKILWPTMTSVTTCSSATLVAISYDRFRAVVHPWKPRFTSLQTAIIIATTWSVSYVLVIPYLLVLSIKDNYCEEVWPGYAARHAYTLGLFVIQFVVPIFIIAFAYTKVVLKLRDQAARFAERKKDRDIAPPEITRAGPSSSAIQRLERDTKIVKMLVTVVLLYVICMLPNHVVWLWIEFGSGQNSPYIRVLLGLGSSMVYVNSSVNPILYAGMNDEFRRGFIGLLRRRCKRPMNK